MGRGGCSRPIALFCIIYAVTLALSAQFGSVQCLDIDTKMWVCMKQRPTHISHPVLRSFEIFISSTTQSTKLRT